MSLKKVTIFDSYHARWFFFLASGEIKCYLLLLQLWCKHAGRHRTSAQISAAWLTSDSKHVKKGLTGKCYQGVRFNLANICMGFYYIRSIKCNLYTVCIYIYTYTYICSLCCMKSASKMGPLLGLASRSENSNLALQNLDKWKQISDPSEEIFHQPGFPWNFRGCPSTSSTFWGKSVNFHVASSTATTSRPLQVPGSPKQGTNKKKGWKFQRFKWYWCIYSMYMYIYIYMLYIMVHFTCSNWIKHK